MLSAAIVTMIAIAPDRIVPRVEVAVAALMIAGPR
jgi:hypothetical protein